MSESTETPAQNEQQRRTNYREAVGVASGVLALMLPVAPLTLFVGYVITERRRVRQGWWATWAGVSFLASVILTGRLFGYFEQLGPAVGAVWMRILGGPIGDVAAFVGINVGDTQEFLDRHPWSWVIGTHVTLGVPIGLVLLLWVNSFRNYSRRELGRVEGEDYSNVRPIGVLDRLRRRRTISKVKAGKYSRPKGAGGMSVVGVGHYGHPVKINRISLKKPSATWGGPRTGKTRLGNSLGAQEVRAGGGALVLDFKGDPAIVSRYAEIADSCGRPFLHFVFEDKSGAPYRPLHPYMPLRPAFYDPLVRGNGASKASMVLNSVPRDGDAAAYVRTAYEVVQLAYDLAAMTGYSRGKGGFEVLAAMLNHQFMLRQADLLTPEMVHHAHPWMRKTDVQRKVALLHSRVEVINKQIARSDVLRGAVHDTQTLVSTYMASPAGGGLLRPGPPALTIDLVRAVLRGEVVVFSLSTQDYPDFATVIGTMVLLDLQNAVSTLRRHLHHVAQARGVRVTEPDATPWNPFWVQIEEFGSANSEAVLGLLNKSSDSGLRTLLSTQSWADIVAVDGTGVFAHRVLDQLDNVFLFQLGGREGADVLSDYSGQVDKRRPTEHVDIRKGNRFGFGKGASRARAARTNTSKEPRIDYGVPQHLQVDQVHGYSEMLWIAKRPNLRAVHTIPEGPNSWYEIVHMSPVLEPPYGKDFFAEEEAAAASRTRGQQVYAATEQALGTDPILAQVLDTRLEQTSVEESARPPDHAPSPQPRSASGSPVASLAGPWDSNAVFHQQDETPTPTNGITEPASLFEAPDPWATAANPGSHTRANHPFDAPPWSGRSGDQDPWADCSRDQRTSRDMNVASGREVTISNDHISPGGANETPKWASLLHTSSQGGEDHAPPADLSGTRPNAEQPWGTERHHEGEEGHIDAADLDF